MTLKDDATGISIELKYDEDGFPLISINTGGGFYGVFLRPTVAVELNGVEIHDMFDETETDERWAK